MKDVERYEMDTKKILKNMLRNEDKKEIIPSLISVVLFRITSDKRKYSETAIHSCIGCFERVHLQTDSGDESPYDNV